MSFNCDKGLLVYINTYLSINAWCQYQGYQYDIHPGSPSEPSKKDEKLVSFSKVLSNLDDRLSFDEHLLQGADALLQVLHRHLDEQFYIL